jgi:hypothetical protein
MGSLGLIYNHSALAEKVTNKKVVTFIQPE